jgi:hypothetical protein
MISNPSVLAPGSIARPVDIPRSRLRRTRNNINIGGVAVGALVTVSVLLGRLRREAPTVERATLWMDTVRRGPMVREVLGQGTLVPEEMRWIPPRQRPDRAGAGEAGGGGEGRHYGS